LKLARTRFERADIPFSGKTDDAFAVPGGSDLHVRIADRLGCSLLHSHSAQSGERVPPDIGDDGFPGREAYSNAAGTQRHDSKAFAYNRPLAPVAQWIEQPPPKGQVGRSIRLWGASHVNGLRLKYARCLLMKNIKRA